MQRINRDMASSFCRQTERIARDMLFVEDKGILVLVTKADLIYSSMVWRLVLQLMAMMMLLQRIPLDTPSNEELICGITVSTQPC